MSSNLRTLVMSVSLTAGPAALWLQVKLLALTLCPWTVLMMLNTCEDYPLMLLPWLMVSDVQMRLRCWLAETCRMLTSLMGGSHLLVIAYRF